MICFHKKFPHASCSRSITEQPDASKFEQHCHNNYELLLVLRGAGQFTVEDAQYPLRENTLMLFCPQEYHYVKLNLDEPYERYVINFDATVPVDAAARLSLLNPAKVDSRGVYFSSPALIQRIIPLFQMLDGIDELSSEGSTAREEAALRALVTQILLLLSTQDAQEQAASTNRLVSRVIEYINSHLSESISLDGLAQEFFISKFHLCRTFKQNTGMPLMTYLSVKRIALAQQLLDSGASATEAAMRAGFIDYSSFYRAYRRQTGHSPKWQKEG